MVADGVRSLLIDPTAITNAARDVGLLPERIPALLDTLAGQGGDPLDLVQRAELGTEALSLTVALAQDLSITHRIPMAIKRRGVEMRLVISGASPAATKADPALLKAIARARGWFDELISGRAVSMAAIAQREGISDRYVGALLPLAFLAPDIVEAIAAGRQPADLTAETLIRHIDLPLDWNDQRALLNVA